MYTLLKKEIGSFLSSLIGYIVIITFLLVVSLYMWIFPSEATGLNILDNGYANLDTLFTIAPWVFMFLIPAITMRSFADEKKLGTIELLSTKPITDWQIIFSKYLAGFLLVLFSLIPTLIYFYTVYQLSVPTGNIDTGGIWGSYIGLFFLGAAFVSIGIFSSSLTDNQIVSFIIGLFLCGFCYIGFESLGGLGMMGEVDLLIQRLGINAHYTSMSRGVLDTRDMVYFFSFIGFFLLLTKTIISKRKW